MRWITIVLLTVGSLLINAVSIYNVFLGIASLFLLLIVSITHLFVTLVNKAKRTSHTNFAVRNLANYGTHSPTRTMNKFAVVFGLIVVYVMSVFFTILQMYQRENFTDFLTRHFNEQLLFVAEILSVIGYVLFVSSLLCVTIYCIRAIKKEAVFTG